jgi:hypothetical protein
MLCLLLNLPNRGFKKMPYECRTTNFAKKKSKVTIFLSDEHGST